MSHSKEELFVRMERAAADDDNEGYYAALRELRTLYEEEVARMQEFFEANRPLPAVAGDEAIRKARECLQRHPMQPIVTDKNGVQRFKRNEIVCRLLDAGPFDLNQIALWDVSDEDRTQFAQLIGYSISGYAELGYVSDKDYAAARDAAERERK